MWWETHGNYECVGSFGVLQKFDPSDSFLSIAYTRMGVAHVLTRHGDRSISRSGLENHGCYKLSIPVTAFYLFCFLPNRECLGAIL